MERAQQSFKQAEKIAARYDVQINRRIERARQAGPSIVQYVRENDVDVLLMADIPKTNRRGTRYARSVEYVLETLRGNHPATTHGRVGKGDRSWCSKTEGSR